MTPAVPPTKLFFVKTRDGHLAFVGRPDLAVSSRPLVIVIHGAYRAAGDLAAWLNRLEDLPADVALACLPGHGNGPELSRFGVSAMIENLEDALAVFAPRGVSIVGESLGGLIALGLDYPCVAFDPPLTTAKLWPIWASVRRAEARGVAIPERFTKAVFGSPDDDRRYHDLLDRPTARALVVLGDQPLQPPRDLQTSPSLVDDADRAVLASKSRIRTLTISGGHDLLNEAPDACERLIREFLGASFGRP